MKTFEINPKYELEISSVNTIITEKKNLVLSDEAKKQITKCREYLDKKLKNNKTPIYGGT